MIYARRLGFTAPAADCRTCHVGLYGGDWISAEGNCRGCHIAALAGLGASALARGVATAVCSAEDAIAALHARRESWAAPVSTTGLVTDTAELLAEVTRLTGP